MTPTEALNEFNILYNNIDSNRSPGLDEYEISVLCTKAQEEILKNYLTASSTGNSLKAGLDDIPKRQMDFSNLIKIEEFQPAKEAQKFFQGQQEFVYPIKDKALCVLNEFCKIDKYPFDATVVPISYNYYKSISMKPWKYPPKNQVWKISFTDEPKIILISYAKIESYVVRYVRVPYPCMVIDELEEGYTINGKNTAFLDETESPRFSEAPEELHREIIQRAVELAKGAYDKEELEYHIKLGERRE